MEKNSTTLIQRLTILMYFEIAGLACSLLVYIPFEKTYTEWLQILCNVGSILCIFFLIFAGKRYLKAAIFGTVQLVAIICVRVITWVTALSMAQGILPVENAVVYNTIAGVVNLIGAVAGIVYVYQIYHAHGDLVKDLDAALSRKWGRLFGWELLVSILISVASMIFATIYVGMGGNMPLLNSTFYTLVYIPSKIITLISILYLKRTIHTIQCCEE